MSELHETLMTCKKNTQQDREHSYLAEKLEHLRTHFLRATQNT